MPGRTNRGLVDRDLDHDGLASRLPDGYESTAGVVGFGDIGRRTASLLSGFNVDVLATDPYVRKEDTDLVDATLVELDSLPERSDAVFLSCGLTDHGGDPWTVSTEELGRMKETAYLVNTARGPVVDEDALADALENDEIAGAGLGVFTEESPRRHRRSTGWST